MQPSDGEPAREASRHVEMGLNFFASGVEFVSLYILALLRSCYNTVFPSPFTGWSSPSTAGPSVRRGVGYGFMVGMRHFVGSFGILGEN